MLRPQSSESEVVQNPKVETISMAIRAQRLKLVSRVIGDYLARFGEGFSIPDLGAQALRNLVLTTFGPGGQPSLDELSTLYSKHL